MFGYKITYNKLEYICDATLKRSHKTSFVEFTLTEITYFLS